MGWIQNSLPLEQAELFLHVEKNMIGAHKGVADIVSLIQDQTGSSIWGGEDPPGTPRWGQPSGLAGRLHMDTWSAATMD
jgi:hypothetical protein